MLTKEEIIDDIKKGKITERDSKLETFILEELRDPYTAALYAIKVIKGRWEDAHDLMREDLRIMMAYSDKIPRIESDEQRKAKPYLFQGLKLHSDKEREETGLKEGEFRMVIKQRRKED